VTSRASRSTSRTSPCVPTENLSKNFYRAIEAGDTERAAQIRDEAQQFYNKAATKGVIHRNKASRKTSRLDKALAGTRARANLRAFAGL
jgi:ribosomal protein S20